MSRPPTPLPPRASIRPASFGWRTGTFRSGVWLATWIGWTAFWSFPLLSGWLLKLAFDALADDEALTGLLIAIGVTEIGRWAVFLFAIWVVIRWWAAAETFLRTNMLHAQTVSGGPRAASLPASPSESIARFQQDVRDAVIWPDAWVDGASSMAYAAGALAIMATISVRAAVVALLPLLFVVYVTRRLTPRLYAARAADRDATSTVSSFLGEAFSAMLAFRLAGREEAALRRLDAHNAVRRKTAVRDTVLQQMIDGLASTTTDVTIGLTLLVLVPSVRSGDLSVGDLALFVVYATNIGSVPRFTARLISGREQAIVSYRRMGEMVAPDRVEDLFAPTEVTIEPNDVMRTRDPDPERVPLETLRVSNLSAVYADTEAGIHDVSFEVPAGSFVVVTGGVGAGKSTLLKALVGLVPSTGTIEWNGEIVADVGAWFVPPQSAHVLQVPRLFSESLAENIALGRDQDRLDEVLTQTTLDDDLDTMPDGLTTRVGSRGLRLSGGQAQRVATARSLLPRPEVLVVDDLSSALDVTTERRLWDQLAADTSTTVIAVSHRRFVIDQADQVITLAGGRIESIVSR